MDLPPSYRFATNNSRPRERDFGTSSVTSAAPIYDSTPPPYTPYYNTPGLPPASSFRAGLHRLSHNASGPGPKHFRPTFTNINTPAARQALARSRREQYDGNNAVVILGWSLNEEEERARRRCEGLEMADGSARKSKMTKGWGFWKWRLGRRD